MNDGIEKDLQVINRELKRFHCLEEPGWIGGVCAGLAYRLGVAIWLIRLALVLTVLTFGVGVGIYILLWIFVPNAAKTPSDYAERTGDTSSET